ncbi:MAG TPA: protein kinase [Verrucomicrobiae bacterium]|nr:protein kinase [Verrucomicrobiae bacterium]
MMESQKIGRYEIIEEKGRGAMGAVYIARDPAMDRIVALKTIHALALSGPQAEEFRERFYREARAAGGLSHPGIVTIFDVGEQDGVPYLVMEFIEGRTLADAAKNGQRFTFERVCEIGQQVAEALAYAHKHGVIHRDIKPANILLTSEEKYGVERPKITDFGVAKLGAAQLTSTGQILGSPAFMPPEQFTGAPIDGRSDLFSLGVILYWMATGEYAFTGETITAISYKVVHTEAVPPRKLNPAVPAAFDEIILKCLAKSPSDRYSTGDELAHDLAALRAGRPAAQLQAPVPVSVPATSSSAMDVTLDSNPAALLTTPVVRQSAAAVVAPTVLPQKKRTGWIGTTVGLIFAALLLAGGWYGYANRERIATILDPNSGPEPVADTTPSEATSKTDKTATPPNRQPRNESLNKQPARSGARNTTPSRTAVSALPPPPRVDFDPKQLDPNANAKLKIEADHFPANVAFTVEMGGKVYFERGGNNNQQLFDDLYVPPGVTEFRVIAGEGANRKTSNIVSAEFKPKKKKTLRIELRTQGQKSGSSVPSGVYVDSQIVVTLK